MSVNIKTYNNLHNLIYQNNLIGGTNDCTYLGFGFPNICVINKNETLDDNSKSTVSIRQFSTNNIVSISDILSKKDFNNKTVKINKRKTKKSKK